MRRTDHKRLWENLLAELCREVVNIDKRPTQTVEDLWVKATIWAVLRKMCALDRLPQKLQKPIELTMPLFKDDS